MKQIAALFTTLILITSLLLCLCACKDSEEEAEPVRIEGCEVSMISDDKEIKQGSLAETTWASIQKCAAKNSLGCKHYEPEKPEKKSYMDTIDKAVEEGAKLIVLPGGSFEVTAYEAQKKYKDIYFLLLDGIPHSEKNSYKTGEKTIGIVFAEEEAGYLAGYSAVKEGYTKLGFIGAKKIPAIKRYGYGFVQGADDAASESKTKVKVNYKYMKEPDEVKPLADEWYGDGIQVIFPCGGVIYNSVIHSADENNGKMIGTEAGMGHLSESVIVSAVKNVDEAVENVVDGYADDRFTGGTAFNYAVKNNGIMLDMASARFNVFNEEQYEHVFEALKNGRVELKKDKEVESVGSLEGEWISINY